MCLDKFKCIQIYSAKIQLYSDILRYIKLYLDILGYIQIPLEIYGCIQIYPGNLDIDLGIFRYV